MNREEWLTQASEILKTELFEPAGHKVPEIRISCGFSPISPKKTLGCCFSKKSSKAGINEIFIAPSDEKSAEILSTLTHEMYHAVDDCEHGHAKEFIAIARSVHLSGKPKNSTWDDATKEKYAAPIIEKLGEYPHREIVMIQKSRKPRTTYKVVCDVESCDFVIKTTKDKSASIDLSKQCLSYGCEGNLELKIETSEDSELSPDTDIDLTPNEEV